MDYQQISVEIPTAVMYDTHMTSEETLDYARKLLAVDYYQNRGISIGYCAQIAGMNEEDFMKYLGQKGISVFHFDNKEEFLDELNNA